MSNVEKGIGGVIGMIFGLIIDLAVPDGSGNLILITAFNSSAPFELRMKALSFSFVILIFTTALGGFIGSLFSSIKNNVNIR